MAPSRSLQLAALVAVTTAADLLLIQACGGGAVEGSWEALVTVPDCTTAAAR